MQGWRLISVGLGSISLKSIDDGLLIDLGDAIWDKNSPEMDPVYPKKYCLTLFYVDKENKN